MKVLHINCNYMDTWLHQTMVNTLEDLGIENRVFVPLYKIEGHIVKPKEYVTATVCFKKWDRISYHYKQKKIYNKLKHNYNFTEFSCLHAYTVFTDGNVARKLAKEFNLPYIVVVRNTDVNCFFKYMLHLRATGIRVLREAKAVIFLSKAYQKQVLDKYVPEKYKKEIAAKSFVIPNGIDDFWHQNLFVDRPYAVILDRLKNKQLKLVYAGGIDKNKNITTTCEVVKILRKRGWTVNYTVVGKIKEKNIFEQIKDQVNYLDAMPKEKLIDVYRNADVFVMPSHTESFGLVYAEAMSQGLPVIYTKGQGFDGQFEEGIVGYAVSDEDVYEISERIIQIVNEYTKISSYAVTKVKKFKWKTICERYIELYQKCLISKE